MSVRGYSQLSLPLTRINKLVSYFSDYKDHMKQQQEAKHAYDMLDVYPADKYMGEELQAQIKVSTQSSGIPHTVNSFANEMPNPVMQMRMKHPMMTSGMGMNLQQPPNAQSQPTSETNMMQSIGISNSVLNASLGLPIGTGSNMSMPMTSMPASTIPSPGVLSLPIGTGSNMNIPMTSMPASIPSPGVLTSNLQGLGIGNMQNMQIGGIQSRMQVPGMPATTFQNAMPGNNIQGLQPNMPTSNMNNNMQSASGMPAYQTSSLFMASDNNVSTSATK